MKKNMKKIYMYNWITMFYTRNSHIVNQLYVHKKIFLLKKKQIWNLLLCFHLKYYGER